MLSQTRATGAIARGSATQRRIVARITAASAMTAPKLAWAGPRAAVGFAARGARPAGSAGRTGRRFAVVVRAGNTGGQFYVPGACRGQRLWGLGFAHSSVSTANSTALSTPQRKGDLGRSSYLRRP